MYCTEEDLYDLFGQVNVSKWADLDNDKDAEKISARVTRAMEWAESEIESLLRKNIYEIPIANSQGEVPQDIKHIAASLSAVHLYENRGIQDFNPETGQSIHRMKYVRDRAMKMLRQILAGQRILDAVTVVNSVVPTRGS